jgi:hypothetical protein
VFGPGFRPNATVARAIGLIVRNVYGIVPQVLEQATQGLPGRWSICLGENEEESPWPPLSVEAGLPPGTSAVSAMLLRTCEFVDNRHTQDPEQILWDFADTISRTGSLIFRDTSAGVVFGPEHANLLAGAGYSRADVQSWLVEHCGRTRAELRRVGKDGVSEHNVRHADGSAGDARGAGYSQRSPAGTDEAFERILPTAAHTPVIVAGSRNAAMSMVVRVFGVWSGQAVPVEVAERTSAS